MENTVYAIDIMNKTILKTFRAGGPITSTVAIIEDVVYVGSWDNTLYALDCKTLDVLWKFQTGHAPQKPRFFGLFRKFSDLKSKIKRFWKPDPKPTNSIYQKEIINGQSNIGGYKMESKYEMKPTYTMDNPYTMNEKKKKDKLF